MKQSTCLVNGWLLTAAIAALVVGQGCGRGEYEKRMQAKVWAQAVAETAAGPKIDVPGMAATLSPPAGMEAQKTPAGPPGTNVPGVKASYEGFVVDSAKGKQYYYCYLVNAGPGSDSLEPMLKSLGVAIQGEVKWDKKDVEEKGADGKPVKFRTAFAKGKQKFRYVTPKNEEQNNDADGVLQVWDREVKAGGEHLLIVWRVPAQLATKDYVNPEQRGRAMALSVAAK